MIHRNGRLLGLALSAVVFAAGSTVLASPILPTLTGHSFSFNAQNSNGTTEYQTNGTDPDRLVFTSNTSDREAPLYFPPWPEGAFGLVFNPDGFLGADFVLDVSFTGQDAMFGSEFDVSLTGSGQLDIYGEIAGVSLPDGLLFSLSLEHVSLYGHSGSSTYVLEGTGTIGGGLIPDTQFLGGQSGAVRGYLDFIDPPSDWLPPFYHPGDDPSQIGIEATYWGGAGTPEPGTFCLLLAGAIVSRILARRRHPIL